MEEELLNFFKVWFSVWISLCYCYGVGKIIRPGTGRLIFFFPVISLFLYLPLNLHSLHLGGLTAFFVAWLANFKLLLFAVDQGPLADPRISIGIFCALASLPIKFNQNPLEKGSENCNGGAPMEAIIKSHHHHESLLNYAVKILLVAALVRAYDFSDLLPQKLLWLLLCFHIYFLLELSLAAAAAAVRSSLGGVVELHPMFHRPYLTTSLQDFWGRRWNLAVTGILRPAVYRPALRAAARFLGPKWAPLAAVAATFLASAAMHEFMFFYMSRAWPPSWEISAFFVLHGGCLAAEMVVKRLWIEKWRLPPLPPAVSVPLTVGFFFSTCFWLFFPPFINDCRADVRVVEEYALLGTFVKNNIPSRFYFLAT